LGRIGMQEDCEGRKKKKGECDGSKRERKENVME
jgi:hypothetical protein